MQIHVCEKHAYVHAYTSSSSLFQHTHTHTHTHMTTYAVRGARRASHHRTTRAPSPPCSPNTSSGNTRASTSSQHGRLGSRHHRSGCFPHSSCRRVRPCPLSFGPGYVLHPVWNVSFVSSHIGFVSLVCIMFCLFLHQYHDMVLLRVLDQSLSFRPLNAVLRLR